MAKISKASKVSKDSKTIHTQHNALAEAFNSRILSGLGDCAWRIFYYAFSTFRGVRNPDGYAYPAQDEWFKFYAYLEPKAAAGKFGWPEAPAGEAQGANVANPFMAWIFGNNTRVKKIDGTSDNTKDRIHGFWSEAIRLGGLEAQPPRPGVNEGPIYRASGHPRLSQVWFDSEIQRGCCAFIPNYAYSLSNGLRAEKVVQLLSLGITGAARRHLKYVMETVSMGRYAPSYVPDVKGKGGIFRKKNAVKDQIDQAMFYYLSFFRGTEDQRAGHNKISPNVADDGFNFETFFSRQFLLAPNYSEPKYELDQSGKIKKDQLGNGLVKYDNIGYPELFPQSPSFYWSVPVTNAIDNTFVPCSSSVDQKFTDTDSYSFTSSSGPFFDTNPKNSFNKFCLASLFIQTSDIASTTVSGASELLRGLSIDVYLDKKFYVGIPIGLESIYPVNKRTGAVNNRITGVVNQYQIYQFNKIYYFQYPVKGKVSFKVRSTVDNGVLNIGKKIVDGSTFTLKNFSIFLKLAHVFEMKPTVADAYTLMRVATTEGQGSDAGQMDPVGHFKGDLCQTVFANYYKFGVAYTLRQDASLYQNETYISANPVYESARKFISNNIKMADRVTLVDYEVNATGQSVLYFLRFAYGMKNSGVDIFRGLGPSITPVGNRNISGSKTEVFIPIVKGKKYIVLDSSSARDGYVLYRISETRVEKYSHSQTFIGGDYYYISKHSNDTVGLYEIEGITSSDLINKKPKLKIKPDDKNLQYSNGNVSNEWTMFMSYNLYHWSNSSAWKPAMYGDIMGALNGRCLTGSDTLEYNKRTSKNVKKHLANVTWKPYDIPLVVEAPTGYNYIEGANTDLSKSGSSDTNYAENFASSCPVYKSPYSIESAVRVNPFDPNCEVIKVTLNTRLTPSKVNGAIAEFKGKASENLTDFINKANAFEFRTDESAIIDYVLHTISNRSCPRGITGDVSLDNRKFWAGNRPFGCCYPRFYFVKLIPKVSADTVMYSDHYTQMEYYLRAMCNGFVNNSSEMSPQEIQKIISEKETGIDHVGGYDSAVGDYLFEDLMRKSYDISTSNYIPIPPSASVKQ